MREITLQELKERPINPKTKERMERTKELCPGNIYVYRFLMSYPTAKGYHIWHLTHNGNDPKSNEQLLDDARMYIEKQVYTDEQWEQYIIPAINEAITFNDSFVRWYPGYLIREKGTGKMAILEYDYSTAFGGRDYTDLSVCVVDENGKPRYSMAWKSYKNYELVDSGHTAENIRKLQLFNEGKTPPRGFPKELRELLYK